MNYGLSQASPVFRPYQLALSLFCLNDLLAWLRAFGYPDVAAYHGALSESDASQDRRITVNDDVILEYRVTGNAFDGIAVVVQRETLRAERNALIQFDIVANDASRSNDNTSSVVDGEVMTYLSSRMDVNSCFAMGHFSNDARNQGHAQKQEFVGNSVAANRLDDRIATDDFAIRLGCRITIISRFDVRSEDASQFWHATDKLSCNRLGLLCQFARLDLLAGLETKACQNLLREQLIEAVQTDTDVIGECFAVQRGLPIESWKQDGSAKFDNLGKSRS